jgi:hypothetical protein
MTKIELNIRSLENHHEVWEVMAKFMHREAWASNYRLPNGILVFAEMPDEHVRVFRSRSQHRVTADHLNVVWC